jgi:hypothetical protein
MATDGEDDISDQKVLRVGLRRMTIEEKKEKGRKLCSILYSICVSPVLYPVLEQFDTISNQSVF